MKICWIKSFVWGMYLAIVAFALVEDQKPLTYSNGLFLMSYLFIGISCITATDKK